MRSTRHHAFIGEATESGKSNFLATTICSLAVGYSPAEVRSSLPDPQGIDFGRFESLPHVDTYVDDATDCFENLESLLETELQARKEKLQQKAATSVTEYSTLAESRDFEPVPYRVIVIDEFADLVMPFQVTKRSLRTLSVGWHRPVEHWGTRSCWQRSALMQRSSWATSRPI
ncbi:FtsK/SpoIIIE domain-containing protein [Halorhabdus tiamatea]|uniref:FtsK/SpoIIIE domain-containing protein n=1 Tax=Halorhabdus tiamatea TaxID=430914 RepID=UPI00130E52D7